MPAPSLRVNLAFSLASGDFGVQAAAARAPRASVMLSATVECFGGGAATKHRVRDLSPGGIRIDAAEGMRVGATVLISVGVLEAVGATVKWLADGYAGLEFAEEIDPDQARARTAIISRPSAAATPIQSPASAVSAGWVADMENPYRK